MINMFKKQFARMKRKKRIKEMRDMFWREGLRLMGEYEHRPIVPSGNQKTSPKVGK